MAGEWLWIERELKKLAEFSVGNNGISRLAFSPEEKAARLHIESLMQEIGMQTRVDAAGNLIGKLEGRDSDAAVVATGSHLDTVPEGGRLDGVLGVLCSLAAVKAAAKRDELRHPLELIVFSGEEPSRFGLEAIGCKAMVGLADPGNWQKLKDETGANLKNAFEELELTWADISNATRSKGEIKAFLEVNIEQGGILEKVGMSLGMVEEGVAPIRFKIVVEGLAAHTGVTPVEERQDALVTSAKMILAVQEIAQEHSGEGIIATIGQLKVSPGAINVVPGQVEMWAEICGRNGESVIECLQEVKDAISTIAEEEETTACIEMLSADRAVRLSETIIELIEDLCQAKGIRCKRIENASGKNAMHMARICSAGLLVLPVRGSINEQLVDSSEVENAVEVMTETLLSLAK